MFNATINKETKPDTIPMHELKPMQWAVITDPICPNYNRRLVMRNAAAERLEVMDMGNPGEDSCWTGRPSLQVTPLEAGTVINLVIK